MLEYEYSSTLASTGMKISRAYRRAQLLNFWSNTGRVMFVVVVHGLSWTVRTYWTRVPLATFLLSVLSVHVCFTLT